MSSYNRVILMGNLTRDPDTRYLQSGTAVTDMGLAVNETYAGQDGQKVEKTVFVDVVVWAKQAEACAQYLGKGSPVLVEGRLQLDQWETKDGEKRSKLRVRADRVQFLGRPRQEGPENESVRNGEAREIHDSPPSLPPDRVTDSDGNDADSEALPF